MSEDCYFYVDMEQDVPDEERKVSPLCIHCHEDKFPGQNVGWFWQGSINGYGPWVYQCKICGRVIHKPDQEEYEKITTTHQNT